MLSATVTPEAALVKIAVLRTLVALMAILWAFEWSLRSGFPFNTPFNTKSYLLQPYSWPSELTLWLRRYPTNWLLVLVVFFVIAVAVSTLLSASFDVSLWGSVPGQDGYAAYTLFSYVLFFCVVAAHLKTRDRLWRLIGAILLMSVLFSGFAILQHYTFDPLELMEHPGSNRVTSTAGNPIFAASLMLMTITTSLAVATAHLRESMGQARFWCKLALWVPVIAIQCLGIMFTLSRGPWVGTTLALGFFLALAAIFVGWRTLLRAATVLALTAVMTAAVVLSLSLLSDEQESVSAPTSVTANRDTEVVVANRFASISGPPDGSLRARFEIWESSFRLWHDPHLVRVRGSE